MLTFNKKYLAIATSVFAIEVIVAFFIRDNFVRPYLGDVLVVMLLYAFIRSFLEVRVFPLAMTVMLFSFSVEFLQYVNIIETLGLAKSTIARIIIGTSFSWLDMLAYAVGIAVTLIAENTFLKKLRGAPNVPINRPFDSM